MRMPPMGSYICILSPLPVSWLGSISIFVGGIASLEEVDPCRWAGPVVPLPVDQDLDLSASSLALCLPAHHMFPAVIMDSPSETKQASNYCPL